MFKKIIALMFALLVFSCGIMTSSFNSKAVGTSNNNKFSVNYPQPDTSDGSGYLTIYYTNSSGHFVNTFFWTLTPYETTAAINNFMDINITSNNVTFNPNCHGLFMWQLAEFTSGDNLYIHEHGVYKDTDNDYLSLSYGSGVIQGFIYNGNVGTVNSTLSINNTFEINFSNSVNANKLYSYLDMIWSHLEQIDGDTSDIVDELVNIYNQNVDINTKLDDLKNLYNRLIIEQEESNTWLEKIFNFLEEKDEKEKEAATQQGSSSTSQGMDAIEDKGGDFVNSLGGLTNSMSYSGTQCAWEFPEVKIPAISGVMDEVVLIQRQPIDFAQWVNAIPSDILLVVQSICTIGLIVYCFKELYNTIAYVLTLRRDDNE